MEETVYIDVSKKWIQPGDQLTGEVFWALEKPRSRILVRFGWFTEGRGTSDNAVVAEEVIEHPGAAGQRAFAFTVPDGPYSFEGHLITLSWVVEVVVGKEETVVRERVDLVAGEELIQLPRIEDESPRKSLSFQRDRENSLSD